MPRKIKLILVLIILLIVVGSVVFLNVLKKNDILKNNELLLAIDRSYKGSDVENNVKLANTLLSKNPTSSEAKIILAKALLNYGSLSFIEVESADRALILANEVLATDPNNRDAYLIHGYANEIKSNFKEALVNYNMALSLGNEDYLTYYMIGHVQYLMGDYEEAYNNYNMSYIEFSDFAPNLLGLANIYFLYGDYGNALNFADLANNSYNGSTSYLTATAHSLAGIILDRYERYDEAVDLFTLAIETYPKMHTAYSSRAHSLMETTGFLKDQVKIDLAYSDIDKSLQIYPKGAISYFIKGELNQKAGKLLEAQNDFIKSLELINNDITIDQKRKKELTLEVISKLESIK